MCGPQHAGLAVSSFHPRLQLDDGLLDSLETVRVRGAILNRILTAATLNSQEGSGGCTVELSLRMSKRSCFGSLSARDRCRGEHVGEGGVASKLCRLEFVDR